jgi:Ca2+-binding RTX toxin-like protein
MKASDPHESFIGTDASDTLTGTVDGDVLLGRGGNDTVNGSDGDDLLDGGAGNDRLDGGAGSDTVDYGDASALVRVNLALTAPQNTGGGGRDTLLTIEHVIGSAFADVLRGDGNDNRLDGRRGNDKLYGNDGNDMLIGGLGVDTLNGGGGADLFMLNAPVVIGNRDRIEDFISGEDYLALSRSTFAAFAGNAPGELSASAFVVGTKALTADQHLVYNAKTGALFYDADGVGGQSQTQIAMLVGDPVLSARDFLMI